MLGQPLYESIELVATCSQFHSLIFDVPVYVNSDC